MKCKNRAVIRGYVGKHPRIKNLPNGDMVANFSVATTTKWKNKATGEWMENTEWHDVQAWKYLAERVERDFKKGSFVEVEGKIVTERWNDKESGQERQRKVIKAADVDLLEKRQAPQREPETGSDSQDQSEDDDLPF